MNQTIKPIIRNGYVLGFEPVRRSIFDVIVNKKDAFAIVADVKAAKKNAVRKYVESFATAMVDPFGLFTSKKTNKK